MYLITYYALGYGSLQHERIETAEQLNQRLQELQAGGGCTNIEVWKKATPIYA
jgi:hypothetical protein